MRSPYRAWARIVDDKPLCALPKTATSGSSISQSAEAHKAPPRTDHSRAGARSSEKEKARLTQHQYGSEAARPYEYVVKVNPQTTP